MDGVRAAATAIERLRNFELRLKTEKFAAASEAASEERTAAAVERFREAMDDDLNTAGALGVVFEFLRDTNSAMDSGKFLAGNVASAQGLLNLFDSVFDVMRPTTVAGGISDEAVEALIAERVAAKKARNFGRADEVRAELDAQGIVLEDTKDGPRWKRK